MNIYLCYENCEVYYVLYCKLAKIGEELITRGSSERHEVKVFSVIRSASKNSLNLVNTKQTLKVSKNIKTI